MISQKNLEVLKYMAELRGTTVENVVNSLIEAHLAGSSLDKGGDDLKAGQGKGTFSFRRLEGKNLECGGSIEVVKAVRSLTGCSLREAKDTYDTLCETYDAVGVERNPYVGYVCPVYGPNFGHSINVLRGYGIHVEFNER